MINKKKFLKYLETENNLDEITSKYAKKFVQSIIDNEIKLIQIVECLCGCNEFEVIAEKDRFELPFQSFMCIRCGLVLTNPQIAHESIPKYYEQFYHHLIYGATSIENKKVLFSIDQGKKIYTLLEPYLSLKETYKILEIGCGTGNVLSEFRHEAYVHGKNVNLFGTEYNNECRITCEKNGIEVTNSNIKTLVESEDKYDIIILSHVFEHFIDLNDELSSIYSLLDDDGLLYIEVPGILSLHENKFYNNNFQKYLIHAHIYNFYLSSLHQILALNGYELLYGNEIIESIFKKGKQRVKSDNQPHHLKSYLNNLVLQTQSKINNSEKIPNEPYQQNELFIFLNPNYTSNNGASSNIADRIHRYCRKNSIEIEHYISSSNTVIYDDKKKYNLLPIFTINSKKMFLSTNIAEIHAFLSTLKVMFKNLKTKEKIYSKIYIYTDPLPLCFIKPLVKLFNSYCFKFVELHIVIYNENKNNWNKTNWRNFSKICHKTNREINSTVKLYANNFKEQRILQTFFESNILLEITPLHHEKELEVKKIIDFSKKQYTVLLLHLNNMKVLKNLVLIFGEQLSFIIHQNNSSIENELKLYLNSIRQKVNITHTDSYIDESFYTVIMRQADIVVLPCSQDITSKYFAEAIWYDHFMIMPTNEKSEKYFAYGVFYEEGNHQAIIDSIQIALTMFRNVMKFEYSLDNKMYFIVEKLFQIIRGKNMEKCDHIVHEAFNQKDINAIQNRKSEYLDFMKTIQKTQKPAGNLKKLNHIVVPAIESIVDLAELIKRLSFSLPNNENFKLTIALSASLDIKEIDRLKQQYQFEYFFDGLENHAQDAVVLINDMNRFIDLESLSLAHRVEIIDKDYFSHVEAETLRKLFYKTFSAAELNKYTELSKKNFYDFKYKNILKKEAFCFTTGPSFDEYSKYTFSKNSLKIICNSIVKNKMFLQYIEGADLIVFADPVFHFGPSVYAEIFRRDVIDLIENTDVYIAIPDYNVPLLLHHYPILENKIIGISGNDKEFNFPTFENFYVKNTANILTLLMLPLASSIADTIFIVGADGRQPQENYFWQHSSSAQYTEEMESAFLMHPSFFRDRDYEDYYIEHCTQLENLICYGEKLGKVYCSITPSYIPALKKRWIDFTMDERQIAMELLKRKEKNFQNIQNLKSAKLETLVEVNHDFALKMNILYQYIEKIQSSKAQIAIYGNGLIGNIIARELKNQVVGIFDKNDKKKSDFSDVYPPEQINDLKYDFLIITVLGREESILNSLQIDRKKAVILDLRPKQVDALKLIDLDRNCPEFNQKNLRGPYPREAALHYDETKLIHEFFGDKKQGTMIDIGAHVGSSSRPFLESEWTVYGYEPEVMNRQKLMKNLGHFKSFHLSDKALSDKAGLLIDFYVSEESDGVGSLLPFTSKHDKKYQVMTTTLSDEIKKFSLQQIDFLKIDTEGYDLFVLQGMLWNQCKPLIIECEFENYKTEQLGYTVMDMIHYLKEHGYNIYVSEWHPIQRYGIKHQWKRFFKFDDQEINTKSWGNLLAFLEMPNEDRLIELLDISLGLT